MTRPVAILGILWLTASSALAEGATAKADVPVIRSVRGHLFDAKTGRLSEENVLAPSDQGRWNDTSSDALFVVVEVAGPPLRPYGGKLGPKYDVQLVATDQKRSARLLSQAKPITVLGEQGSFFVSFLVPIGHCNPVRVVAKILGRNASSKFEAVAAFACGE